MVLTMSGKMMRILSVDETETGNAEVQPVRDSRLKATSCRRDSGLKLLSHSPITVEDKFTGRYDNSELCNALKNLLAEGQAVT